MILKTNHSTIRADLVEAINSSKFDKALILIYSLVHQNLELVSIYKSYIALIAFKFNRYDEYQRVCSNNKELLSFVRSIIAYSSPDAKILSDLDLFNKNILDSIREFRNNPAGFKKYLEIDNMLDCEINKLDISSPFMHLCGFKSFIKDKTISLVANSKDLLKRQHGSVIDSQDIVVRFNSFALNEPHTGTKTSIHCLIHLHNHNDNIFCPLRFIVCNHVGKWARRIEIHDPYSQSLMLKCSHASIFSSNPSIYPSPPSSGFVMLQTLLHIGGFKSIKLFGFTFYKGGFDDLLRTNEGLQDGLSKVHDYAYEEDFIKSNSYYDHKNNIYIFSSSESC